MEHITHDVTETWHVFAGGEWRATEYDGYAPPNVQVDGRWMPVEFRHTERAGASNCGICNR